jgi:hypothetical protein
VSNAVDFLRLDEEGRGYRGDPEAGEAWYGFGEPGARSGRWHGRQA